MAGALLHVEQVVSPREYLAAAAGMLDSVERAGAEPRLGIFGLTGQALLLGRHQRATSAVRPDEAQRGGFELLRRLTGGRTVAAGEGTVAVAIALPNPSALVQTPIPLSKVMNRYVRGVLAMSNALKAPSYYFARDFVSCGGRQIGYLSFEARPTGATLVECLVAVNRSIEVPGGLVAYPPREDGLELRPCTAYSDVLGRTLSFDEVRKALVDGHRRAFGVELSESGQAPRGQPPEVGEDESGFESSGVADIAIGYLEALVRLEGSRIAAARLRGDFLAPSEAVRRIEGAVTDQPLEYVPLGRGVDEVCKSPFATLMGIKHLRIIPDAFLEAGRAVLASPTESGRP